MDDPQKNEKRIDEIEKQVSRLEDRAKVDSTAREEHRAFAPSMAMQRIVYLVVCGCGVILIFSLPSGWEVFSIFSVGIMTAGAAGIAGGLLGFVFGVPFLRENGTAERENSGGKSKDADTSTSSSPYQPNTNLEQISDWLSKMLLGVGLIELKTLAKSLRALASYISPGLGGGVKAEASHWGF